MKKILLSDNNADNIFYVHWRILNACNYECSYCSENKSDSNCVYVRDRIMRMAWRIIEEPGRRYFISLAGGEPTLHPFLPDIINYFFKSGRDVGLALHTNGSRELDYYTTLLEAAPKNSFILELSVHPSYTNIERILMLIALTAQKGQYAHITLFSDISNLSEAEKYKQAFVSLRAISPFSLTFYHPNILGNQIKTIEQWDKAASDAMAHATSIGPVSAESVHWNSFANYHALSEPTRNINAKPKGRIYCCQGVNYARIDPDGYFYGSSCPMSISPNPLWRIDKPLVEVLNRKVVCDFEHCPSGLNEIIPKFSEEPEADAFLARMHEKNVFNFWQYGNLPEYGICTPGATEVLRARFGRLLPAPESCRIINFTSDHSFIFDRISNIQQIYDWLADDESRDAFLRIIKAILTDNSVWLKLADYELFKHPRMNQLQKCLCKNTFSTVVPLSYNDFVNKAEALSRHSKPLMIAIDITSIEFLNILQWLSDNMSDYAFYLGHHKEATIIYGDFIGQRHPLFYKLVQDCKDIKNDDQLSKLVSAILTFTGDSVDIAPIIDSVILQNIQDIEIIIAENLDEKMVQIFEEYKKQCPIKIRHLHFSSKKKLVDLRNAAFDAARGKNIIFMENGSKLPIRFLDGAMQKMSAAGADMAAFFNNIPYEIKRKCGNGLKAVEQMESLIGCGLFPVCIYNADFLIKNNFRHCQSGSFSSLQFMLNCAASSSLTIFENCQAYHAALSGPFHFTDFAYFARFLTKLYAELGIDENASTQRTFTSYVFNVVRHNVFGELIRGERKNYLDDILTSENVEMIGSFKPFLDCILSESALLFTKDNISTPVRSEYRDWDKAAAMIESPKTFHAYGSADTLLDANTKISVIIPNYNKKDYLRPCLDSIFSQSLSDIEVIVVDDASTDGSWDILCDYADFHPNMRLYRMDNNCRQGICRNIGMEKARGDYIVFVDSDDLLAPDFLKYGYQEVIKNNADIGVFSAITKSCDGTYGDMGRFEDATIFNDELYERYVAGEISAAVWAKLFRTNFVRSSGCLFEEYVYHQDHYFMARIIKFAKNIIIRSFVATIIIESKGSSIRPSYRSYLQIYSCLKFFELMDEVSKGNWRSVKRHINWNIQKMFLPALASFYGNTIPIISRHYPYLQKNTVFLKIMLLEYARILSKNGKKAIYASFTNIPASCNLNPLITIALPIINNFDNVHEIVKDILPENLDATEILILDKIDNEETRDLLNSISQNDGRVKILPATNCDNEYSCWNLALRHSKGKYIVFCRAIHNMPPNAIMHGLALMVMNQDANAVHIQFAVDKVISFDNQIIIPRLFALDKNLSLHTNFSIFRTDFLHEKGLEFPSHNIGVIPFLLDFWEKGGISYILSYRNRKEDNIEYIDISFGSFKHLCALSEKIRSFYENRYIKGYNLAIGLLVKLITRIDWTRIKEIIEINSVYDNIINQYIDISSSICLTMSFLVCLSNKIKKSQFVHSEINYNSFPNSFTLCQIGTTTISRKITLVICVTDSVEGLEYIENSINQIEEVRLIFIMQNGVSGEIITACDRLASNFPDSEIVHVTDKNSFAQTLNYVMAKSGGEYIAIANAAWIPDSNYFMDAIRELENNHSVIMTGCNIHVQKDLEKFVFQKFPNGCLLRVNYIKEHGILFGEGETGSCIFFASLYIHGGIVTTLGPSDHITTPLLPLAQTAEYAFAECVLNLAVLHTLINDFDGIGVSHEKVLLIINNYLENNNGWNTLMTYVDKFYNKCDRLVNNLFIKILIENKDFCICLLDKFIKTSK